MPLGEDGSLEAFRETQVNETFVEAGHDGTQCLPSITFCLFLLGRRIIGGGRPAQRVGRPGIHGLYVPMQGAKVRGAELRRGPDEAAMRAL